MHLGRERVVEHQHELVFHHLLKNDEFCIKHDEFCIDNEWILHSK